MKETWKEKKVGKRKLPDPYKGYVREKKRRFQLMTNKRKSTDLGRGFTC